MDELEIKGKKYISSKRASELTGYAKDYVGQLARAGKIPGTRMGRAWYVEEVSLLSYKREEVAGKEEASSVPAPLMLSPIQKTGFSPATIQARGYVARPLPSTWTAVKYYLDESDLIPNPQRSKDFSAIQAPQIIEDVISKGSIRIKKLEDGVKKVSPTEMVKPIILEKSRKIRQRRSHRRRNLALGALTAALLLCLFLSSGLVVSSHIAINAQNTSYSANLFTGYQHLQAIALQYPAVQQGVGAVQNYFTVVSTSFASFFSAGISYLFSLFNQAFGK